jgi:hypothetical protein
LASLGGFFTKARLVVGNSLVEMKVKQSWFPSKAIEPRSRESTPGKEEVGQVDAECINL